MRRIQPYALWLGHRGDIRDLRVVHAQGIRAVIDLALEEPPVATPRELMYCRLPLLDGAGNTAWLLDTAVNTTAQLLRAGIPTLVCCSNGMSRTPTIAVAAIAKVCGCSLSEAITIISSGGGVDASPGLWTDVSALFSSPTNEGNGR
jgi:hypothetical protein